MRPMLKGVLRLGLRSAIVALALVGAGCDKDKPKPDETKKSETTPVPSGMVFNDFLPTTGNAAGLGVRDSGIEGGLGAVAGGGEPGDPTAGGEPPPEKLKVVEPGAEPRTLRKYAFAVGKTDKRLLTITQSMSQSMQGQASPPQEIVLKLSLELTPKQVKPAGALVEMKVTKVDLPGAPPQAAPMLASMNGLTGTFEVTSRGEVGEVSFHAGAQMKNQLAESVVQGLSQAAQLLLTPFPEVPIGVGAKWELGGAKSEQPGDQGIKRFALKEVSADTAVVDTDIEIKVPRRAQPAPRGGGMMFVEVDGKGKYVHNLRFDRMASKVDGEVAIVEKIEVGDPKGGGGKQVITQTQKSKHVLEAPK
jgi:hypothetical protein